VPLRACPGWPRERPGAVAIDRRGAGQGLGHGAGEGGVEAAIERGAMRLPLW
jgi:hypothetical protein